jgi:SWI/SNF-related matrix-associated actin-dependent regulator of chromatin subfamily B protein 1
MKLVLADPTTGEPVASTSPEAARAVSVKQPRIRCKDCKGKVYNPGPEETVGNFEKHLRNATHRKRVNERVQKPTAPQDIAKEEAAAAAAVAAAPS